MRQKGILLVEMAGDPVNHAPHAEERSERVGVEDLHPVNGVASLQILHQGHPDDFSNALSIGVNRLPHVINLLQSGLRKGFDDGMAQ